MSEVSTLTMKAVSAKGTVSLIHGSAFLGGQYMLRLYLDGKLDTASLVRVVYIRDHQELLLAEAKGGECFNFSSTNTHKAFNLAAPATCLVCDIYVYGHTGIIAKGLLNLLWVPETLISENGAVIDLVGPKGDKGDTGHYYIPKLRPEDNEVFVDWANSESSMYNIKGTVNIRGPVGPKGEPGKPGLDGTVSFDELTDDQRQALKGDKGDQGAPGEDGAQGPRGYTGPRGPQGPQGGAGVDGVGIENMEIIASGEAPDITYSLQVTLTDGRIITLPLPTITPCTIEDVKVTFVDGTLTVTITDSISGQKIGTCEIEIPDPEDFSLAGTTGTYTVTDEDGNTTTVSYTKGVQLTYQERPIGDEVQFPTFVTDVGIINYTGSGLNPTLVVSWNNGTAEQTEIKIPEPDEITSFDYVEETNSLKITLESGSFFSASLPDFTTEGGGIQEVDIFSDNVGIGLKVDGVESDSVVAWKDIGQGLDLQFEVGTATGETTKLFLKGEGVDTSIDLASIEGLKGETGEQGPQGPQGPRGYAGPQGPQGCDGVGISSIYLSSGSTSDGCGNTVSYNDLNFLMTDNTSRSVRLPEFDFGSDVNAVVGISAVSSDTFGLDVDFASGASIFVDLSGVIKCVIDDYSGSGDTGGDTGGDSIDTYVLRVSPHTYDSDGNVTQLAVESYTNGFGSTALYNFASGSGGSGGSADADAIEDTVSDYFTEVQSGADGSPDFLALSSILDEWANYMMQGSTSLTSTLYFNSSGAFANLIRYLSSY